MGAVQTFETTDGAVVQYTEQGAGLGVLLIHAGVFSDWFAPLAEGHWLDAFHVVRIRRAGYVDGAPPANHVTMADHARHVAEIADRVGLGPSIVVGHSSGALVALELAIARADLVDALVLLEPAPGGELAPAAFRDGIGDLLASAHSPQDAYDRFMTVAVAEDHRDAVRAALGDDGLARAERESEWFFRDEVPAVGEWTFSEPEARNIVRPTTLIVGGNSSELYHSIVTCLDEWLADSRIVSVEGADHLLPLRRPDQLAEIILEAGPTSN